MSRNYDNWEKLVAAVLKREDFRRLALCDSFSTSNSTDFSARPSFDSDVPHDYRYSNERLDPGDISSQETFVFRNVKVIEYGEIKKATKNFHPGMLWGKGAEAFGCVYKGWIHEHNLTAAKPGSGITVAIKKLNRGGYQGNKQLADEIHYLSQLRHPNLIKLVGYSCNADNRILVYEFMRKGSLDNHLFARGHNFLNWATRVKVAIGAARAIAFLHDLEIPVIHRNIKSSNILLDGDFNTKLSGFGLARDGLWSHVSIKVMGTYEYAAPEYVETGELTMGSDVYGFGAVLLEIMSGRRIIDSKQPAGEHNLIDFAKPYLNDQKRLARIVDSKLEGKYPPEDAYEVAKICLQCLSIDEGLRPKMSEVLGVLESL
ncbi:probable serine/threonine-protein kinase PBL3 [Salvia splendens]|uniref:probable serine/threonine-protein kinase PBL3 n=1 Tax=Salvia splendens TaxID=180675 RepID=UPI001C25B7BE|nr:probable serine/threonine-protein kinase PBL3 [Salvia splendens]